mgnify:CR=1 FL=1
MLANIFERLKIISGISIIKLNGIKRFTVMFAILFLFAGYRQEELNCFNLKNGTFLYRSEPGNPGIARLVIRKGDIQWEINQKTNDTSVYLIKWTGMCSYDLYFQKNSNDSINLQKQLAKHLVTRVQVLTSTNKYYIFKWQQDNFSFAFTDTLWIKK